MNMLDYDPKKKLSFLLFRITLLLLYSATTDVISGPVEFKVAALKEMVRSASVP